MSGMQYQLAEILDLKSNRVIYIRYREVCTNMYLWCEPPIMDLKALNGKPLCDFLADVVQNLSLKYSSTLVLIFPNCDLSKAKVNREIISKDGKKYERSDYIINDEIVSSTEELIAS